MLNRLFVVLVALATVVCPKPAAAEDTLTVSPLFSSYAVVQRDQPVRIQGTAAPSSRVTISFADRSETVLSDDGGRWSVEFASLDAGGPHKLNVNAAGESLTSHSILVGDVWLCSGQSNMGFRLENADGGPEAVQAAANTNVRMIQMQRRTSTEALEPVDSIGWRPDAPDYAGRFSAVGYFFGQRLEQDLDVPIGLIESTWGGSPLEAWTPAPTLASAADDWAEPLLESLPRFDVPKDRVQSEVARYEAIHAEYIKNLLSDEQGLEAGWQKQEFSHEDWLDLDRATFFEPVLGSLDGVVWLRKTVQLDESDAAHDAVLHLGMVDEYDDTFVNGVRVGGLNYPSRGAGRKSREYAVPADVLVPGENTIAVRVVDTRTAGGFGSLPSQIYMQLQRGEMSLAGAWKIKVSHDAADDGGFPLEGTRMVLAARQFRRPSALYNGMVHALTEFPIKGVIWYQGESNSGRADQYRNMFKAMISSWREAWNGGSESAGGADQFPFYFVQLPNYRARAATPEESSWADLREAQAAATSLPNVGMAVTIDVGDPGDIHPRDKKPVGDRLADAVLADVYAVSIKGAHSPTLRSAVPQADGSVLIELHNADGLATTDGSAPKSFALSDDGGTFVWAQASIEDGRVRVFVPGMNDPSHVRYAWAWNPETNLVNSGGKPVAPFRADLADPGS